jgi:hypothetical protein
MLLCHGSTFSVSEMEIHMQAVFLAVLDESFPMIPLNPDSVKWLVTFCFWTLKYRDIGL